MKEHVYIAIDLKSFYASVECRERNLDALTTNLVVADVSRTEKTICLAVSPALKAYGIPGRARLFEVVQSVKQINRERLGKSPGHQFTGSSVDAVELRNPSLKLDYIAAVPQMALYMKVSSQIYQIYLKYIAPEDMHVYSIDEVFMDVTQYLDIYKLTARELAMKMIHEVLETTGITATAGIGSNLYLCKIAMDIGAKHVEPDKDGVRIAELTERSYRETLWSHRPLTDFWRVGRGYVKKLEQVGLFTMGDIARCSLGKEQDYYNEDLLYKMFGVNAELLIDHAWGYENVTIADVKAYKPKAHGIGSGQVLQCPYSYEKTRLIVKEMTELLVLDLVSKRLVTDKIVLTVGYDIDNLSDPEIRAAYHGEVTIDRYGRAVPKHAHGTASLKQKTSSTSIIMDAVMALFDRIMNPVLLARRVNISAEQVMDQAQAEQGEHYEQLDLFSYFGASPAAERAGTSIQETNAANREELKEREEAKKRDREAQLEKERKLQEAMLNIKGKYGKNAILKGMNLEEGGMTRERNRQIGGHKA